MRKELLVYIKTNEEGEEVKVQRVTDDPNFFLFTLGANRMVIDINELMDAVGAISHYSTLFDQETMIREARAKAPPLRVVEVPTVINIGSKKSNPEDDGALILEAQTRSGPTASELALEAQTKHMQGDSFVLTEKDT
jgi:hypothetical protein